MKMNRKGFTLVELLVVIGILGILMGALFPAISSAMLSANLSACSMRGRNLFVGITTANTEREAAGLGSVWPKDATQKSEDTEDIAGNTYGTSTLYFEALFDLKTSDASKRQSYVSGVDVSVLSGSGVPAMTGSSLTRNNVAWCVAQGVADELDDIVPVLFTRNASKDAFPTSQGSHETVTDKNEITLGKNFATPFADKAFVAVTKGGAAKSFKSKYAKVYIVYNKQSFAIPDGVTFAYLEP